MTHLADTAPVTIPSIETVCFIGGGTMGCFNALMASAAAYKAVIFDISDDALGNAKQTLNELGTYLASQGFFDMAAVADIVNNIELSSDLASAAQSAQLISESVSESLPLKRSVHKELDQLCDKNTIITTNTSGLLVSEIEDVLEHGERFAALHSHLGSTLFDIVPGPRTSKHTIDALLAYVERLNGKALLLKKENPGYVLNAMIGPFLTVAKMLVIDERASLPEIDQAWMASQNAPIGPFGLMDLFGLNVVHDSWQKPKPMTENLQEKILQFIGPYIEAGTLGAKTGKGFYSYPDPAYSLPSFVEDVKDKNNVENLLASTIISAALQIVQNDVASQQQVNEAWCFSFGLDKGPFDLLADMGEEALAKHQASLFQLGLKPA